MKKKVLVAMSGGVDSSVAALLLQEQGYAVEGITLQMSLPGDSARSQRAGNEQAIQDARAVCRTLDIRHQVFACTDLFEKDVIAYFVGVYREGRTPNPCVVCNRTIKFGELFAEARRQGADFFATGHYAGKSSRNGTVLLRRPRDRKKDQTYFLYGIPKEALPRILFPLEDLTKEDVYARARKSGLPVVERKQSQDICFIPDGDYASFVRERVEEVAPGDIVSVEGRKLGNHKGIAYYTIGQRSGLGIAAKVPLYVLRIDAQRNTIVVGEKKSLRARTLLADEINFFQRDIPEDVTAQIRYAHTPARCHATLEESSLRVAFDEPQEAVTPGQSVVLYHEGYVLGGGSIKEVYYDDH